MRMFIFGMIVGTLISATTTTAVGARPFLTGLDLREQWIYLTGWRSGYWRAASHVQLRKDNPNAVAEGITFLQQAYMSIIGCQLADMHQGAQGVVITYDKTHEVAKFVEKNPGLEDTVTEAAMITCGKGRR